MRASVHRVTTHWLAMLWSAAGRHRLLSAIALMLLVAAGSLWLLDRLFPFNFPDEQQAYATVVTDRQGQPLRAFADGDGIWRYRIGIEDVSPAYLEALLTYEDRWFYYHPGVNPLSLMRALGQRVTEGRFVSGGSTLSMQVARQFHPHSKTLGGKLTQILRALQLEWHRDKDEILEYYLNYAPFGGTIEGVQAASYGYLGKPASELTRADAALLAVLPQSPTRYRPDLHPDRAERARNKVLDRMVSLSVWSAEEVADAKLEPVISQSLRQPMWAPLLARRLVADHTTSSIDRDVRVLNSSIDLPLQQLMQSMARDHVQAMPDGSSAAIMVVDNESAAVQAYVGTAFFGDPDRAGHVDMVQAVRSPGSTLKPLLYGLAIDDGLVHSHSLLADVPRSWGQYRPGNFSGGFSGPVTVSAALRRSLNAPVIDLLAQYGSSRFDARLRSVGLDLSTGEKPNLSIILGGTGISLEKLVMAYRALATDGQVMPLKFLLDDIADTRSDNEETADGRFLLSPGSAWIISELLDQPAPGDRLLTRAQRRSGTHGWTGAMGERLSWKTGTSYGHRDSWAIGYSNRYTIGVWVGRPDGTPLPGHYGASTAAPLLFRVHSSLPGSERAPRLQPASVTRREICWPLGLAADVTDPAHCHDRHSAWVLDRTTPQTLLASDYNENHPNPYHYQVDEDSGLMTAAHCAGSNRIRKTVALWPKQIEPWLPRRLRRSSLLPALDPSCTRAPAIAANGIDIVNLDDQSIITVLNGTLPQVSLKTVGGYGRRYWYVNGSPVTPVASRLESAAVSLQLQHWGRNQIALVDEQGNTAQLEIDVRRRSLGSRQFEDDDRDGQG